MQIIQLVKDKEGGEGLKLKIEAGVRAQTNTTGYLHLPLLFIFNFQLIQ